MGNSMNNNIEKLFGKQFDFYKSHGVNLDEHDVFFVDIIRAEFFKIKIPDLQIKIPLLMQCYQFKRFDERSNTFPVLEGSHKKYLRLYNEQAN